MKKGKKKFPSIIDDQEIEDLMKYYKLESPDILLQYIKMHYLPRANIGQNLEE